MGVIIERVLDSVSDYVDWNTIGISTLDVFNAVMDEVWSCDCELMRKRPEPYLPTTAGTAVFPFSALSAVAPDIRKIRGIYQPDFTGGSDYGLTPPADFDQKNPLKRVFDVDWVIDPLLRTISYAPNDALGDPETTTTKWKIDYYRSAPVFTDADTAENVPVLSDEWVWKLVQPGMIAFWEDVKLGEPGPNRQTYERKKQEYWQVLQQAEPARQYSSARGYVARSVVVPQ